MINRSTVYSLRLAALSTQATGSLLRNVDRSVRLLVLGAVHESLLDISGEAVESLVDVDVVLGGDL